jgi:antitoxin component YwqK of YwqJK toxin-antitoxin module
MKFPILILVLGALGWVATLHFAEGSAGAAERAQTTYFASGQIESKIEYEDGRREGLAERWYSDGKKAAEGRYASGRMVGPWQFWNSDGSLDEQRSGNYRDGERPSRG